MDLKEKEVKIEEETEDKNIEKRFVKIVQKIITLNRRRKIFEEIEMSRQAKIDDIPIPVFDGANYSSWKLRLMTILIYDTEKCS